jgi:hypothetical protein
VEEFEKMVSDCGVNLAIAFGPSAGLDPQSRARAMIAALFNQSCVQAFIESLHRTYNTYVRYHNEEERRRVERAREDRIRKIEGDNAKLEQYERYIHTA